MRKSIREFIKALETGHTSKAAINGIRKTMKWSATDAEMSAIMAATGCMAAVPAEQCEEGRAWLLNASLKKNGELRKNALVRSPESLDIIRTATVARLIGWDEEYGGRRSDGRVIWDWHPVYRYECLDGRRFDYSPRSWQSGGKTIIYGHGRS